MKLNILNSPEDVLKSLAEHFIITAQKSIADHQQYSVALSGGSSPKKLYEMLASDYKDHIDWGKVYFFFGDERFVPQTDPASNYLMAKKALFEPLAISENQIFPVDTTVEPALAATKYSEVLKDFFKGHEANFDMILLGLGDNSHTASLFPYTTVLHDSLPSVKEVFLEDQNVYRITLNAPLINQACHVAFLVYGEGKATAVHHILEDAYDVNNFPAQLIKPVNGEIQWFLDAAAAANLTAGYNN